MPTVREQRILGIQCSLRTNRAARTMYKVLAQIRDTCPRDFARLKRLLNNVIGRKWKDGTSTGETVRTYENEYDEDKDLRIVYVKEDVEHLVAILAHEFGHVCSRAQEIELRNVGDSELASELTADWYAYKWGFERQIIRWNKVRDRRHHGPLPGETEVIPQPLDPIRGGFWKREYKVKQNFTLVFVKSWHVSQDEFEKQFGLNSQSDGARSVE
jgi:hypothetical protein